jgi:hypothetical protein
MHKIAVTLLIGLIMANIAAGQSSAPAANRLTTYPAPAGVRPSDDYTLQVNGQPVFVYTANVLHGGPASFAYFDFQGAVDVQVQVKRPVKALEPVVRPSARGIKCQVDKAKASAGFRLDSPANLSFEPDGPARPLLIFANPPEVNPPKKGDPNVMYFGPGVHEITNTDLPSNTTLYLAGGAVLRGKIAPDEKPIQEKNWAGNKVYRDLIAVKDAHNVTIRGRGILDGSLLPWHAKCPIKFEGCTDFAVEGIIITDSPCWCMPCFGSRRGKYTNVKQVCHRENSDGINICNSQDIAVDGCFLRNNDDEVCVKATSPAPALPVKDVLVRNCVIWNDRAMALGITYETRVDISNVRFENCDVIHDTGIACLSIHVSDSGTISDVTFRDIRVEDTRNLVRLWVGQDMWGHDPKRGTIRGVKFQNVELAGGPAPALSIENNGGTIDDITFDRLRIAGKLIDSAQAGKFNIRNAGNIKFLPVPASRPARP